MRIWSGASGVPARRGHLDEDRVEERPHVVVGVVHLEAREPLLGRGVDDREVELVVGGAEVDHQVEDLVDHLVGPRLGAVDLVHRDDRPQAQLERLPEDEAGLRHRAVRGVHDEEDGVDQLQDALHLPAEVAVPRGVDDVDLRPVVADGRVLGEDRDPALALEVVRVHHPLFGVLPGAERPGLPEEAVDERGLAVVYVSDDGDVPDLNHGFPLPAQDAREGEGTRPAGTGSATSSSGWRSGTGRSPFREAPGRALRGACRRPFATGSSGTSALPRDSPSHAP